MGPLSRRRFVGGVVVAAVGGTAGCSERFDTQIARIIVRARPVADPPADATVVDAEEAGLTENPLLADVLSMVVDPESATPGRYDSREDVQLRTGTHSETDRRYVRLVAEYPSHDFERLFEQPVYDHDGSDRFEWVFVEYHGEVVLLRYQATVATP